MKKRSRLLSLYVQGATALLCACVGMASAQTVTAQAQAGKTCADTVAAIIDVADDAVVRIRTAQIAGRTPVTSLAIRRPSTTNREAGCKAPAVFDLDLLPARLRGVASSAYPQDINDGAMWSGRGVSVGLSAGFEARYGRFSAALYPVAAWQQNAPFTTGRPFDPALSAHAYGGHVIDLPQRFGDGAFATLDPGQSYVRVDAFGMTAGLSTENMWLGPAQRTPLIMGSSAPGFPHVFLSTLDPVDIGIGRTEFALFTGKLSESGYFDGDPSNDDRVLAGISGVFEPAFVPGLFLGFNRVASAYVDGTDLPAYFIDPYISTRDNSGGDNQILSLFARWVLPAAGFEAYGEWAREDHWADWLDFLREPDHSQFYVMGFQKTASHGGSQLRWYGELTHLQAAAPLRGGRGVVTPYTHFELIQGHTNRGQLLGAWIGPGSDAQMLGVERADARRTSAFTIERVRFDDDAYYTLWARFYGQNGHDVSLGARIDHAERIGAISLHGSLGFARRFNRNSVFFTGSQPGNFRAESNVRFEMDARWTPRLP